MAIAACLLPVPPHRDAATCSHPNKIQVTWGRPQPPISPWPIFGQSSQSKMARSAGCAHPSDDVDCAGGVVTGSSNAYLGGALFFPTFCSSPSRSRSLLLPELQDSCSTYKFQHDDASRSNASCVLYLASIDVYMYLY